jgi:hypothetical protein
VSEHLNRQLIRLTLLLQLQQRARRTRPAELPYVVVNETSDFLPYRQALLWRIDSMRVEAASGVTAPEPNAPYTLWLNRVLARLAEHGEAEGIFPFGAGSIPPNLAEDWASWLPEHGLWVPLPGPEHTTRALVLFRETPWSDPEIHLLSYLAEAYGHAFALAEAAKPTLTWRQRLKKRKTALLAAGLLLAAALFPVRQSVLAEAEVIPRLPNVVRAPLDGVVETFFIQPNQEVAVGQKLFTLDTTQLRSKLQVATETLDIALTEYLQGSQQALLDPAAKAKLAGLKSKWEQQKTEVDYLRSLLVRCEVTASQAGVAVFDDPNDWIGRPVTQGEKVLAVADPAQVELEMRLPIDDLIGLRPGNEVLFFPNVAPHHPLAATLEFFSYRASPTPAEVMAYRLKAVFPEGTEPPRLGYRGTAKLYGDRRPFLSWLLRKPLRTLRLWMAW